MLSHVETRPSPRLIRGLILLALVGCFISGLAGVFVGFRSQSLGVRVQGLGVSGGAYANEESGQALSQESFSMETSRKWHVVGTISKEISPKPEIRSEPLTPIPQSLTPKGKKKSPGNIILDPGAGNVGIGTESPAYKLDVAGNARVNNAFIGDVGHGLGWAGFAHYGSANTTGYALLQRQDGLYTLINKKSGGGYIGFRVDDADKMVITDDGNVGIGTTSPSVKLDVDGNVCIRGGSPGKGKVLISDTLGNATWQDVATIPGNVTGGGTANYVSIWTGSNTLGNSQIYDNGTNVGIGTTSPDGKLDVTGSQEAGTKTLRLRGGDVQTVPADAYQILFSYNGGTSYAHNIRTRHNSLGGPADTGNAIDFYLWSTNDAADAPGTNHVMTLAGGKVGIGTTGPGNILTVVQNSSTDPVADAWTTYSSIRWKENITPITDTLDKIGHLNPVYFDWKEGYGRGHDLGLIAEEVGKVIPEVVEREKDSTYANSIDYGRLTALAIAGIKELEQRNAELEYKVAKLESLLKQFMGSTSVSESLKVASSVPSVDSQYPAKARN